MLKLDRLRATILAAVPRLQQDPAQVIVLTGEDGRIISTGTEALSFEMHYTALVWVLGLAEHPDTVIVPALAWHKLQQHELYADPDKNSNAFAFHAQLLDEPGTIDLHLRLQMTERVIVQHDPDTGAVTAAHHAPEPSMRERPERWVLDLLHPDGERQRLGEFDGPALPRAQAYLATLGIDPRRP